MPNKILLADDSMTAQKMGKEILTSAGYEVVAVSNGAAAAKKLADKYAVIILDINMPGYTGFELCEKVRASMEIAKTPVLLTIGKMEHYEPTEVQRVKADGVIIKPFEATDLLATVQKMIEKSAPSQPEYEKTVIMKRSDIAEFKDESYNEWKQESEAEPEPVKKTIEMSHADASAPAFGMDMDEHLAPAPQPAPSSALAAAVPVIESGAPAFEIPPTPLTSVESNNIESLLSPPAPAFEEAVRSVPVAPPTFSSTPSRDPMFEAPANEKNDEYAIPAKDPALAAREEMTNEEFIAKTPAPEPPAAAPSTDAEFEARVAAAMSTGYEEAHEIVEAEPEEEDDHAEPAEEVHAEAAAEVQHSGPVIQSTSGMMAEPPDYERTIKIERPPDLEISGQVSSSAAEVEIAPDPMIEHSYEPPPMAVAERSEASVPDQLLVEQMQAAVQDMPVAPQVEEPVVEHPAPVETVAPAPAPAATTGHDLELANALAAAVGGDATSTMAAVASASSSRTTSVDHNVIAAAVHRAMTKMMPAIMTEVAKELDPEKK